MSSRAEVVNLDPETNPKLKEIFDILLLAGYFRIRIPSITPLDKVWSNNWIKILNKKLDIRWTELVYHII